MTDRLDDAIDRAARELLDVEPRADLPARVLARLSSDSSRHRAAGWSFAWLAAAALIVLAAFVARREATMPQTRGVAHGRDLHLPAELTAATNVASVTPRVRVGRSERGQPVTARAAARVVAAAVDEDRNFTAIAALRVPPAIDVAGLQAPAPGILPPFAPEPMSIRALDVSALSETPRERREE